jgi:drug/metabolite transporter (DMT)-like permease
MEVNTNKKWSLLIILALIWGSSFILIFKGLQGLSAFQLGSVRIIVTALFLWLIGFKSLKNIPKEKWKYIALTALFGTFLPAYLFALAETQVSSSVCSILNSLTPLNTLWIGFLAFQFVIKPKQIVGVLIGLIGTIALILGGNQATNSENIWFSLFVVIASICYAININLIKNYLPDLKPLSISTGNFTVMFLPALLILMCTDFHQKIHTETTQTALLYIVILGVVCTGIANVMYFKLIQISTPIFASSVTYLIPIVACIWGIMNNETLTFFQIISAFVILIGVYLANKK